MVQTVEVPAGGQKRVDWRVKVAHEGEAVVRMKALTDEESDAVEQKFPVYVHGMLKMDSFSGALRPEEIVGKITLNVPAERRQGQSVLEVRYSPSLAAAMVDALPYLAAWSLRLHRADAQPVPADGDHPKDPDPHGSGP